MRGKVEMSQRLTAYCELQGTRQDHQVQLLSRWPAMGVEPTALGISACASSVTLASLGMERFSKRVV